MGKIIHTNVGIGIETLQEWMGEGIHEVDTESGILIVSVPPSGYYKIWNLFLEKTGEKYHLIATHEDEPEP